MLRHLAALAGLFGVALALSAYANPYSVHAFIYVDHRGFDVSPASDGTVRTGSQQINFRLPELSFSAETTSEIRRQIALTANPTDFQLAFSLTDFTRENLNATDSSLPPPSGFNAESILAGGRTRQSNCGEHARVLMELLQLYGLDARILWLEGHVATEYFDRQEQSWKFIDPHLGVVLTDDSGRRLSGAEAIHRLAADQLVEIAVISEAGSHARNFRDVAREHPTVYRNILMNGELSACAGSVLVESGRWTHLVRQWKPPQVLVLTTGFDTSPGRYIQPLSLRTVATTFVTLAAAFYGLWLLLSVPHPWRNLRTALLHPGGIGSAHQVR